VAMADEAHPIRVCRQLQAKRSARCSARGHRKSGQLSGAHRPLQRAGPEDAFGRGPHLFTVLYAGEITIDIENIFPDGFDYRGHPGTEQREEWGDREFIADIYYSVANEFFLSRNWEQAAAYYDKAIKLRPKNTRAYFSKGIALVELGRIEEAEESFQSGIT